MSLQGLIGTTVKIITATPIKTAEQVSEKEFTAEVQEIDASGIWIESPGIKVALIKESGMAPEFGEKKGLVFLPFSQLKAIISFET